MKVFWFFFFGGGGKGGGNRNDQPMEILLDPVLNGLSCDSNESFDELWW